MKIAIAGTDMNISIIQLGEKIVNYEGELYFNDTKPNDTMIKLTDPSTLHGLGWKYKVELEDEIKDMYKWYLNNQIGDN